MLQDPGRHGHRLSGVADGAYGEPGANWVLRGNWMLNILLMGFDVNTTDQIASIARAAAARLP